MVEETIVKTIYPYIDKSMTNKNNQKIFGKVVTGYLDKNIDKLSTTGPVYRTIFSDNDRKPIFDILGLDPKDISDMIKKSNYIKHNWIIANDPFNIVLTLIIRFAKINKLKELNVGAVMYLTLSMYPSLHFKYFKYEPNQEIMAYTIANLSQKFKVKTAGTIWKALLDTTMVSDNTYHSRLIKGTDKDIVDYIMAFKTRLNSMMKKIYEEFDKNHKNQNYFNTEVESDDEDNFHTVDNNAFVTERITNKVILKLSTYGPDFKIVRVAAKLSDISVNELKNTVNSIVSEKENREKLRKIVSAILYLYLYDMKKSVDEIKSNNFLVYSLEIYKKSNISNKNMLLIKEYTEEFLQKYSKTFRKTNRSDTLNKFKRALYIFFVLSIQQSA